MASTDLERAPAKMATPIVNEDTNTVIKVVLGLFMTIAGFVIIGWLSWATSSIAELNGLEGRVVPRQDNVDNRLDRVEQWQADWPQNGELAADVRQNAQLEFMSATQREIIESLQALTESIGDEFDTFDERLRDLETSQQ